MQQLQDSVNDNERMSQKICNVLHNMLSTFSVQQPCLCVGADRFPTMKLGQEVIPPGENSVHIGIQEYDSVQCNVERPEPGIRGALLHIFNYY